MARPLVLRRRNGAFSGVGVKRGLARAPNLQLAVRGGNVRRLHGR
jgi:hypothetical protein